MNLKRQRDQQEKGKRKKWHLMHICSYIYKLSNSFFHLWLFQAELFMLAVLWTNRESGTYFSSVHSVCVCVCVCVLVAQSCPTLFNPMDQGPHGSCVHIIFQTSILEWAAIPFSRGSSRPRYQTHVFHIAGRLFTIWTTRESSVHSTWALFVYICVSY